MMKIEKDLLHQATSRELNLNEYEQLFVFLSNTPHNYLTDTLSSVDIIKILSYLDFYNENLFVISEGIAQCLLALFPNEFAFSSSELLITILSPENHILSSMIFCELSRRIISNGAESKVIKFSNDFMQLVINSIFDENLDVSTASGKLFVNYCKQSRQTCKETVEHLKRKFTKISTNSVYLFRYFDVSLDIGLSTMDAELFGLVIDKEIIDKLNEIIVSDDLLAHVNLLEIIRKLVSHQLGYQLATNSGILSNLHVKLQEISQSPWSNILLLGYLSIFTELCKNHYVDVLKSYRNFVEVLSENITNNDLLLKIKVLEILSVVVLNPDCKIFIHSEYDKLIPRALNELVKFLDNSTTDYQIRSGIALANIFTVSLKHKDFLSLSTIHNEWFIEINKQNNNNKLFNSIFKLIKLPSEDLKSTGYRLVVAISNQDWAIRHIIENTEFIDFLMVRADQYQCCIDLKFDLITNIMDGFKRSANLCLVNANNTEKVQTYFHEGKYFAAVHAEMMVDTDV